MIDSNSFTVYYHEIDTLNRNESLVYDAVKKNPNKTGEELMAILRTNETNKVNPRLTDLSNKNLIKTGKGINRKGHIVYTYSITTSGEFKAPKKTDLMNLKKRVSKLSRVELNVLFEYILELNRK
jgi:predicted transcriptional regulator